MKSNEVKQGILSRKLVKIFFFLSYITIIIISIITASIIKYETGTNEILLTEVTNVNIISCGLQFFDADPNQIYDIQAYHKINSPLISSSYILRESSPLSENITVFNDGNPEYCEYNFYLKPSVSFNSLNINCTYCNITSFISLLNVSNSLNITGDIINSNFYNIQAQSINFQASTGYLQINNIITSSTTNNLAFIYEGDIIIQSTQGFNINFQSPSNLFCFSAPYHTYTTSNCQVSSTGNTFFNNDINS